MNKKTLAWAACLVFSMVTGLPATQAQSAYPPPPVAYSQEQLDQMLAPVALYPDALLAQVLMAATYPLEVVQAQRFVEARPGLQGDGLARAVAPMPWDPSVKSLVQFPAVLAMMNERLDWMQQMGQAFLGQQDNVMDTVQALRERAQVAGSLQSGPQQRVLAEDGLIVIEPVNPQVVYVPYYNPVVVYGNWWWPAAQPVYWNPPPRYRPPHYQPGVTASISFGGGVGVLRAAFGEARPDWRQRQVLVTQTRITNVNQVTNNNVTVNRNVTVNQRPVVWHHDGRYGGARNQPRGNPNASPGPNPAAVQNAGRPPASQAAAPAAPPPPAAQQRPPLATQQAVLQQDQARQRQANEQQAQQAREVQQQQREREQQVAQQQRQREEQARQQAHQQEANTRQAQLQQQQQQRQQQEQVQQQQRQREQQVQEQARGQQQAQQMRQQQAQQAQQAQQQQREQARPQPGNDHSRDNARERPHRDRNDDQR